MALCMALTQLYLVQMTTAHLYDNIRMVRSSEVSNHTWREVHIDAYHDQSVLDTDRLVSISYQVSQSFSLLMKKMETREFRADATS
jgi:hypothetical protein